MEIVHDVPRPIREIEHVWIPLSDGTRLAARIWLPEDAESEPVPGILEYLPYRRRDGTRLRDDANHAFVAGHGYACVRVDMRGSGDADGVLHDEYLPQEQLDGIEVLAWMAAQPWCDGNLGMIGISWCGFNGLQIAAHRPEGLGAIVTVCSTDDRYADDIHYMGGCLLTDNFAWANVMYPLNFKPPDPETYGERWREAWTERLEQGRFWLEPWLEHQRRDAYWEHGSVCEAFDAIACPVLAVGGWADGYSNAIPRLLERLSVPRLGLIGPWAHRYPHQAVPGPAMDFLTETLRWWDRWLKGRDTGIMDEPRLRAWIQDSVGPDAGHAPRAGRWVGEPAWPSPHVHARVHALAPGRIAAPGESVPHERLSVRSPLGVGLEAGDWCSYGREGDLPGDQRRGDAASLVFDSEPLAEPLEILGAPVVELELRSDRPLAMVAVRLNDVRPDGGVTRVSYGLLNLTHRDSHARPEALVPGEPYRVRVQLNDVGQRFPAGHRIRVAISTDYWPIAWPSPEPVTLQLTTGVSAVHLPVRPARVEDAQVGVAQPPRSAPPAPFTRLADGSYERTVHTDPDSGETVLEVASDDGTIRWDAIDLAVSGRNVTRYVYREGDSTSARAEAWDEVRLRREAWDVRIRTRTELRADAHRFHTRSEVEAFEGDVRVFEKTTERSFERDHL